MNDKRVHTHSIRMTYKYILFFSLLLGILIGVDKRVDFQHATDDEEHAFSSSKLWVKHRTPYNLVTRAIENI